MAVMTAKLLLCIGLIVSLVGEGQAVAKAKSRPLRKRSPFFFGDKGCTTVVRCLGAVNALIPYRLNFDVITAADRVKSHFKGNIL